MKTKSQIKNWKLYPLLAASITRSQLGDPIRTHGGTCVRVDVILSDGQPTHLHFPIEHIRWVDWDKIFIPGWLVKSKNKNLKNAKFKGRLKVGAA